MKRAIAVALFAITCSRGETTFPVEPPHSNGNLRALAGNDAIDCGLALDSPTALRVYDCASHALRMRVPFFCRYPPSPPAIDRPEMPRDRPLTWGVAFVGTRNGTVYSVTRSPSGALLRGPDFVGPNARARLLRVGTGMMSPGLSDTVSSQLPKPAAKIRGIVIVECVIRADGTVKEASVLKPLPLDIDNVALQLVKAARFEPARFFGVAIPVLYNVTVDVADGRASVKMPPTPQPVMPQGPLPRALGGLT